MAMPFIPITDTCSVSRSGHTTGAGRATNATAPKGPGFADILKMAQQGNQELRFSRHATQRLHDRGIELTENDVAKITDGLERANAKGAKDSLLLYGNLGLVVNVPSRTVVTAMDEKSMTDKVFTNIDSTVIVPR